ncbi:peroxiredoxin-like family protein [Sphingomonas sp. SUN039]|uniref:peroxiredoxin-like family protein n=1 Tax=Sphingomonas sp. SUN039 TaxID=2937787 RepID=UPI002164D5C0|nr:peroxiredoxin-like family protein [Sphingomonas sp. SUN039]UVO55309.1 AhpC/TSA family protein [Sphingomonas sp. SUN039]
MSNPLIAALDDAVVEARSRDIPLGARLRFVADRVRDLSPVYADAVDVFVGRLESVDAGTSAPQVGDVMPSFMLPDQDGRMVTLDGLLRNGPAVLVFHRGHWCPYCRLNMAGVAEIEARVAPRALVAISPERQQYTRMMRSDAGAGFPFLSDVGSGYALSLNLAIWVDDAMAQLIAGAGKDIPEYQGTKGWIMPIPAVFVVGTDSRIIARHVDPDYRRRMELADILSVLERLDSKAA